MKLSGSQRRRAERYGVELSYIDSSGTEHVAQPEPVLAVMAALEKSGATPPRVRRSRAAAGGRSEVLRCHDRPLPGSAGMRREWGVFLPMYAVRGANDAGIGTVSDLVALADWSASLGASVVSTLPLLAAYLEDPCEPSPYSPVSRRFWNEIYLDPYEGTFNNYAEAVVQFGYVNLFSVVSHSSPHPPALVLSSSLPFSLPYPSIPSLLFSLPLPSSHHIT